MKRSYDRNLRKTTLVRGDLVYMLEGSHKKGTSSKLTRPWKGPAVVIEVISPFLFRVRYRDKIYVVNHDRLKRVTMNTQDIPRSRYLETNNEGSSVRTEALYCHCRGPDTGSLMIQCERCLEWYHGVCVGLSAKQAKSIKAYVCSLCQ